MERRWNFGALEIVLTACYCDKADMTFIILDKFVNGIAKSTKVVGFHYGEPDENTFKGKYPATATY